MSELKIARGHRNMFDSPLLCPVCHEANLHHTSVEAYFRPEEDSPIGTMVGATSHGTVTVDPQANMVRKNPSTRRNGMRIKFFCEHCHAGDPTENDFISEYYALVITQHKGTTYMCWETADG